MPPGESECFIEAWEEAAERTVKEDGNVVFRCVEACSSRFCCVCEYTITLTDVHP